MNSGRMETEYHRDSPDLFLKNWPGQQQSDEWLLYGLSDRAIGHADEYDTFIVFSYG